jgi:hypothetical protein
MVLVEVDAEFVKVMLASLVGNPTNANVFTPTNGADIVPTLTELNSSPVIVEAYGKYCVQICVMSFVVKPKLVQLAVSEAGGVVEPETEEEHL